MFTAGTHILFLLILLIIIIIIIPQPGENPSWQILVQLPQFIYLMSSKSLRIGSYHECRFFLPAVKDGHRQAYAIQNCPGRASSICTVYILVTNTFLRLPTIFPCLIFKKIRQTCELLYNYSLYACFLLFIFDVDKQVINQACFSVLDTPVLKPVDTSFGANNLFPVGCCVKCSVGTLVLT